jgi:hypothetical protein
VAQPVSASTTRPQAAMLGRRCRIMSSMFWARPTRSDPSEGGLPRCTVPGCKRPDAGGGMRLPRSRCRLTRAAARAAG